MEDQIISTFGKLLKEIDDTKFHESKLIDKSRLLENSEQGS